MRRYLVLSFGLLTLGLLAVGLVETIRPSYPTPPMPLLEDGTLPAVADTEKSGPPPLVGAKTSTPRPLTDIERGTPPTPADTGSGAPLAQAGTEVSTPSAPTDVRGPTGRQSLNGLTRFLATKFSSVARNVASVLRSLRLTLNSFSPEPAGTGSDALLTQSRTEDRTATPAMDTSAPALTPTSLPPAFTATSPPPTSTPTPLPTWAQPTWTPNPNATPTFAAPQPMLGEALPPAPEGSSLREIQERGWLIVGVTQDVPVFGYVNPDTGGLEGFEVELATYIAKNTLGDARKIEYRAAGSGTGPGLDVVLARIPTTAAPEAYDLSDVYFASDQALLIPKGGSIQGIQNLAGRTVAVVEGSAVATLLLTQAPQATQASFGTYADAFKALEDGQAVALAGDAVVLQWLAGQAPDRWQMTEPFARQAYAVAVPKGQPELLDAVNRAIRSFKDSGEWEQAYAQLMPGPVPQPPAADYKP